MSAESREKLQSFLRSVRQEGTFDSEGVFTLDQHRAAGKLAAFLLPRGGYWALKVVQAACLSRAVSLSFRESREALAMDLEFARPIEHNTFVNQLLYPGLEAGWTAQLAQAVRALGSARSWLATLECRGRTTHLSTASGQLSSETHDRTVYKGDGARFRLTTERSAQGPGESELLNSRALTSSVPLSVNGQRIDDLRYGNSSPGEAFPIGVHWVTSSGRNGLVIPPGVREEGVWTYVPAFTPDRRVNRMLAVNYHYLPLTGGRELRGVPVSSSLNLVRHGVVLQTLDPGLHHPISADLFLFADDDVVDLSGLNARAPSRLQEQAEEEMTAFSASLRELGRQLSQGRWRPRPRALLAWGGAAAMSLAVLPPLLPFLGAGLGVQLTRRSRWEARLRHRAVDALESFRRELPIVIRRG